MSEITFTVSGTPKPQPRPRAYRRGASARVYNPDTADGWKMLVGIEAEKHAPEEPLSGPLSVSICFDMPRPKSHYGTGRNAGKIKVSAPENWHTQRPDVDNLAKAVLDVMTEAGIWYDDDQISELSLTKEWEREGGVSVLVRSFGDE